ncbi:MAG: hypothetical protein ABIQ57_07160 [Candidatus Kapaibacterium sp.]
MPERISGGMVAVVTVGPDFCGWLVALSTQGLILNAGAGEILTSIYTNHLRWSLRKLRS